MDKDIRADPEASRQPMRGAGALIVQKFDIEELSHPDVPAEGTPEQRPPNPEGGDLEGMPALEPVTEDETETSADSEKSLTIYTSYENGLPTAHSVIKDDRIATELENSGLLQRLPIKAPASITQCGGLDLVLDYASRKLTPYFLFVLRLIEKSYKSLPCESRPMFAVSMLHHAFNVQSNSEAQAPAEVNSLYIILDLRGMMNLVVATAPIVLSDKELSDSLCLTDNFTAVVSERVAMLRMVVPGLGTWLDVLQGLKTTGPAVIEGLSEFTGFNSGLQIYLDSVCQGELLFSSLETTILPLNLSSVTRHPKPIVVPASPSAATTAIALQEEKPPINVRYGKRSAKKHAVGKQPSNQVTREQLIQQGDPGRVQITRDTTTFSGVVKHDDQILSAVAQSLEETRMIRAEIAQLKAEINEKFSRLEASTTAIFGRFAQHDLSMRQTLNQTLLTTQTSPAAVDLITAAPQTATATAIDAQQFKNRLLNWQNENLPTLCSELKAYLKSLGHVTFADNLSVGLLENRLGRRGVREKLSLI